MNRNERRCVITKRIKRMEKEQKEAKKEKELQLLNGKNKADYRKGL